MSVSKNTAVYPEFKASMRLWLTPWKAYLDPYSKYQFVRSLNQPNAEILDIGCGVDSVRKLKALAPLAQFDGIDIEEYQMSEAGKRAMRTYSIVPKEDFFRHIQEGPKYDGMVLSHVIEHLDEPNRFLEMLLGKLKPGGKLYVSTPCMKSVDFLALKRGCLNFYDDPTHTVPFDLEAWSKQLPPGYQVSTQTNQNRGHALVFMLGWIMMPWVWLTRRKTPFVWYAMGFESVLVVEGL